MDNFFISLNSMFLCLSVYVYMHICMYMCICMCACGDLKKELKLQMLAMVLGSELLLSGLLSNCSQSLRHG